jgi:hypothetical protein
LICNRFYFLKLFIILWFLVRVLVGPTIKLPPSEMSGVLSLMQALMMLAMLRFYFKHQKRNR